VLLSPLRFASFGPAVADLRKLMEAVSEDPGEQDMLRLRGESRALIEERIGNAQGMADDLFQLPLVVKCDWLDVTFLAKGCSHL